jgi:hypothetical protein
MTCNDSDMLFIDEATNPIVSPKTSKNSSGRRSKSTLGGSGLLFGGDSSDDESLEESQESEKLASQSMNSQPKHASKSNTLSGSFAPVLEDSHEVISDSESDEVFFVDFKKIAL